MSQMKKNQSISTLLIVLSRQGRRESRWVQEKKILQKKKSPKRMLVQRFRMLDYPSILQPSVSIFTVSQTDSGPRKHVQNTKKTNQKRR